MRIGPSSGHLEPRIADHPRHITADWVYLRFHGDHYSGSYTPAMLKAQAQWIKEQDKRPTCRNRTVAARNRGGRLAAARIL